VGIFFDLVRALIIVRSQAFHRRDSPLERVVWAMIRCYQWVLQMSDAPYWNAANAEF